MTRHCLLLDLKDDGDLIAAYRAWHAPGKVPAAVIADIRRRGIQQMEIWHAGDRLVMVVETDGGPLPRPPVESETAIAEWETAMDRFQRRLPFADPTIKWLATEQIFNLTDHET